MVAMRTKSKALSAVRPVEPGMTAEGYRVRLGVRRGVMPRTV